MNKILGIALFAVLIAALTGAVAAEPSIDTYFADDNGTSIDQATVGDTVNYVVNVTNGRHDSYNNNVQITPDTDDVNWDLNSVQISDDGGATYRDPTSGEVTIDLANPVTINWWIGTMDRYQSSILLMTGVALALTDDATAGYTTADADLFSSHRWCNDPTWVDESVSTIVITQPQGPPASGEPEGSNVAAAGGDNEVAEAAAAAGTVPLESTGGEVALAFLALSMIGGGLVSAKMK
ncbi:MAG: hypothetical protein ACXVHS_09975 [Methanobacterium sp.]